MANLGPTCLNHLISRDAFYILIIIRCPVLGTQKYDKENNQSSITLHEKNNISVCKHNRTGPSRLPHETVYSQMHHLTYCILKKNLDSNRIAHK